jgi:arylsulfatase A-like enzyme
MEFARLVDIAPTVLALAAAPAIVDADGQPLLGRQAASDSKPAYVEAL